MSKKTFNKNEFNKILQIKIFTTTKNPINFL